jgi:hypothetical protein
VWKNLTPWHDTELLNHFYKGTSIISGSTLLGNDIIEKLAVCGSVAAFLSRFLYRGK